MNTSKKLKEREEIIILAKKLNVDDRNLTRTILQHIFFELEKTFNKGWQNEFYNLYLELPLESQIIFVNEFCQLQEERLEMFFYIMKKLEH